MNEPAIVLRALRRPLDPILDPSSLTSHDFAALWAMLVRLFRSGNHRRDDLGLGIPDARKRLVAMLAYWQHRMTGMAGAGLLGSSTRRFLLEYPRFFVATELTWLLECYDELCIGYPLVAMEARQFLRRAVRGALILMHAWDERDAAVIDGAISRALTS